MHLTAPASGRRRERARRAVRGLVIVACSLAAPRATGAGEQARPRAVLLLSDSEAMRSAVRATFEPVGWRVTAVSLAGPGVDRPDQASRAHPTSAVVWLERGKGVWRVHVRYADEGLVGFRDLAGPSPLVEADALALAHMVRTMIRAQGIRVDATAAAPGVEQAATARDRSLPAREGREATARDAAPPPPRPEKRAATTDPSSPRESGVRPGESAPTTVGAPSSTSRRKEPDASRREPDSMGQWSLALGVGARTDLGDSHLVQIAVDVARAIGSAAVGLAVATGPTLIGPHPVFEQRLWELRAAGTLRYPFSLGRHLRLEPRAGALLLVAHSTYEGMAPPRPLGSTTRALLGVTAGGLLFVPLGRWMHAGIELSGDLTFRDPAPAPAVGELDVALAPGRLRLLGLVVTGIRL